MPVSVGLKSPDKQLKAILRDLQEHPDAMLKSMKYALNDTSVRMRDSQKQEMIAVFQNPRPYTLNAIYAKKVINQSDNALGAGIAFREWGVKGTPAYKYLWPNIEGGPRRMKRSEKALQAKGVLPPGKYTAMGSSYPKDPWGDITGGVYTRMLAELNALPGAPTGPKGQQKKRKKAADRFFLWYPGYASSEPTGIAERQSGGRIRIFLKFISKPNYKPRYDFEGLAAADARRIFEEELQRQWYRHQPISGYGGRKFALKAA